MRPLSVLSGVPDLALVAITVVFWLTMIVATFLTRSDVLFARRPPETRRERLVTTVALATLGSFLAGTALAPPEPTTQVVWYLGALVVTVPVARLCVT
jgi:peptidoglycan/LPS O-acetylase OafA/YrhL